VSSAQQSLAADPVPLRTHVIMRYDTGRYPFAAVLRRDVFGVPRLELLHEHYLAAGRQRGQRTSLSQDDNLAARELMQDLPDGSPFQRLYHHFLRTWLARLVGRPVSYSGHAKMRVHFPGTDSVSGFHADVPVTRRIDQVNLWVPFTDVEDSAALWLESGYGLADFAPVPLRYGEALIFDGGYLEHGSVPNSTGLTRVSMDLRFAFKGASSRAEGIALMNHLIRVSQLVKETGQ
jgi:hypothetical protein